MNTSHLKQFVRDVFESALSPEQLDSYLKRTFDQDYWRQLSPSCSIAGQIGTAGESAPLSSAETETQRVKLRREGYFQTRPVIAPEVLGRLRQAIDNVRAEHWPAVFAFVYDEFWEIVRTPSIVQLVSACLGEGYRQNARIWAFYVAPARGARGWHPHSDSTDVSRLTVWVPLTDATVDNGCMYVIPRDRLTPDLRGDYHKIESVSHAQLDVLLQSTRALPSPAGAFLGWTHDVVHWGSVSSGIGDPRVSLALEFVGANEETGRDELPLSDIGSLPPFADRLRAIARGLRFYSKYEPSNLKYEALGTLLAEKLA